MFLMLARLGAIVSAIFIPVISQWVVVNEGQDAVGRLDREEFELEFNRYFSDGLQAVSDDIADNSLYFLIFILLHMFVVAFHGVLYSPKFSASSMRERWLHLVSSFWLPLPFLTIREVDRGEEKSELWFLVTLHTVENIGMILVSRWVYFQGYPLGLFLIQISLLTVNVVAFIFSLVKKKPSQGICFVFLFNIVAILLFKLFSPDLEINLFSMELFCIACNLIGVALAVFYASKIELYSNFNLPDSLPDLPSFGPQDVPVGPVEVDYRHHQHQGSIGEPIEEDSTSKEDLPTGPFEEGHHNHHQGSVREQLEEETFEQDVHIELAETGKLEHHRMSVTELLEDDETFEQDVYIELTEVGHHRHRRRESFREKPEGDETLEQDENELRNQWSERDPLEGDETAAQDETEHIEPHQPSRIIEEQTKL